MRKTLSLFFVLALLLAGCSQSNIPADSSISSEQNNITESETADNSSVLETEINSSDRPFIIEGYVPVLREFANGDRYDFNFTIRNNSGRSMTDPWIFIDFLNSDKDILWSDSLLHKGTIKDGQSYTCSTYLNHSDFEFNFVDDFQYVSITYYKWDEGEVSKEENISDPELFPLS